MNDEQDILALSKAIIEISQDNPTRIIHAIDGVSESIEKLNSTLAEQLRQVKVELDIISSTMR
jgi:hypothetical protein